jgi:hypothetical protein
MADAIITRMTITFRFDHPNFFCSFGQTREPTMPELGVNMPIRIRAEGCMLRVVLPKRIAVDVIVVKPVLTEVSDKLETIVKVLEIYHLRAKTRQQDI